MGSNNNLLLFVYYHAPVIYECKEIVRKQIKLDVLSLELMK